MSHKLVGYIDTEDEVEDYLSLETPVFNHEGQLYIQEIDDSTHTIKRFNDVRNIKYIPHESDHEVSLHSKGLYLFKHNEEVFIGNKEDIDDYLLLKINTNNFELYNLYSLYTFLGLREKVIDVVHSIIEEDEYLEFSDFVIPEEVEVRQDDIVLSERAVSSFANKFFSLTGIDYSDLVLSFVTSAFSSIIGFHLGFHIVARQFIFNKLDSFTKTPPKNDLDIRLNDFIMGIFIVTREKFPANSKFWHYVSEEIVKSEEYTNDDLVADIKSVEILSSTTFFLLKPEEPIGEETFIWRSFRVEKSLNKIEDTIVEPDEEEDATNERFKQHILENYSRSLVRS